VKSDEDGAPRRSDDMPEPRDDLGDDEDPRRVRSRTRLVDEAVSLLKSGGVEAVTVNAVSRASKVARTTLYRHFGTTGDLLAAAFDRLLPDAIEPTELTGSLRDQLVELMHQNAALADSAPMHTTVLAWLAISTDSPEHTTDRERRLSELRERVIAQYRSPLDHFLDSDIAQAELGDVDHDLAVLQLAGPLVFARLSGILTLTAADRERIVDDFLAAHRKS
jgi:AcrR family transcriptional regulator